MKIKNNIRIVLLVLLAPWLGTSLAADVAAPRFSEEFSKQDQIYHSRGEKRPEGYTIDRSLAVYAETFTSDFELTIANLGPQDRWLDIGAGTGQAILDYFTPDYDQAHPEGRARRGGKAHAVAISIEDRRTPLWHQTAANLGGNQIRYLSSRRLREYSLEELGKFHVITDVIGGFSYTEDLSLFMEKVLGFLELNGSFYTVLQDVHSETGTNKPYYAGAPFLTEIKTAAGSEVKVCSWLKSIACVQVACELKMGWKPPIEIYSVRKTCNDVNVPALTSNHFEAGTPPERGFRLKQ